jgi:hypothetical protein
MPSLRGPSHVPIEHEDNEKFDDKHLPFITNHDSSEGHGDDTPRRRGSQPWFLLVNGMVFCLSTSILLVAIIYVHRSMLDINLVRKTSFYCKHPSHLGVSLPTDLQQHQFWRHSTFP